MVTFCISRSVESLTFKCGWECKKTRRNANWTFPCLSPPSLRSIRNEMKDISGIVND
jgi:hypothetical protein